MNTIRDWLLTCEEGRSISPNAWSSLVSSKPLLVSAITIYFCRWSGDSARWNLKSAAAALSWKKLRLAAKEAERLTGYLNWRHQSAEKKALWHVKLESKCSGFLKKFYVAAEQQGGLVWPLAPSAAWPWLACRNANFAAYRWTKYQLHLLDSSIRVFSWRNLTIILLTRRASFNSRLWCLTQIVWTNGQPSLYSQTKRASIGGEEQRVIKNANRRIRISQSGSQWGMGVYRGGVNQLSCLRAKRSKYRWDC